MYSLSEKSITFKYALLTLKVSTCIKKLIEGSELNNIEYDILSRGANLLESIIKGSILIEQKPSHNGFSPSQEGLSAYGRALSAIEQLNTLRDEEDVSAFFLNIYDNLKKIIGKEALSEKELSVLNKFFDVLSDLFGRDTQKDRYIKTPSKIISSMKSYSFGI